MAENPDYSFIVQQLERMSTKMDEISKEVQLTNIEMAKLGGMKFALQDLKTWKENVESAVNAEDLKAMKNALAAVQKNAESMDKVASDIKTLREEKDEDKKEIDKLNTFRTQVVTYGTIVGFIFTTALVVLGWFLS